MGRKFKNVDCVICGTNFTKQSTTHKACSDNCRRLFRNLWRKRTTSASASYPKAKRREWYLRSKYGLEPGDWEVLFARQNGSCAVCGSSAPGNINGWCTDHNHVTGKVRGILCHRCNTDVGGYDRVFRNIKALQYVGG